MYDWSDKKDECYRLYVEEGKALEEVAAYFREKGFEPSTRAFQAHFKQWGFQKYQPAHKNEALVARCRQLWEKNFTQKEILETLQGEGFRITDKELLRLRRRLNMYLRQRKRKRKAASTQDDSEGDEDEEEDGEGEEEAAVSGAAPALSYEADGAEEVFRGTMMHRQVTVAVESSFVSARRRRRTNHGADPPANVPGEPIRYPSETTLDESKAYLHLDNDLYAEVRGQFKTICEEEGVSRKSTAGPEKWGQVKGRLVREHPHLRYVFQQDPDAIAQIGASPTPTNARALALDIICMDVVKLLRIQSTRLTIADARNALGLNPEEARKVRSAFLAILKANNFTNQYETGLDFFNSLKQSWIRGSALSRALSDGDDEATQKRKMKAIDALTRDALKRYRADRGQKDPSLKSPAHTGIGPGPAPKRPKKAGSAPRAQGQTVPNGDTASHGAEHAGGPSNNGPSEFQIDPSLILAASDPSMLPETGHFDLPPIDSHFDDATYSHPQQQPYSLPLPIYLRLHLHSQRTAVGKSIWLSIFQSGIINELRAIATREHPGTVLRRLEGVIAHKVPGSRDLEVTVPIDEQEELEAYLRHVVGGAGSGKATFVVWLGGL
ncbi:uncharacterized protein EI97DRAFT_432596 [Westerdykella ornata]|uniref:Uncharacterized protein n=1 Tax=Westerdykella ornata TaxID=318751 RepID=A0A6A6JPU6_WESOR|nr:uncharacterized protein EI97DRAFT_432596 [Westerdykella ornata]KAF2276979.1 hypothetical protein EI97DRAFT_432596 [Westerdykella ornata]